MNDVKEAMKKEFADQVKKCSELSKTGNFQFQFEIARLSGMKEMIKHILTDEEIAAVIETANRE